MAQDPDDEHLIRMQLVTYLLERVRSGDHYFKSKFIAEELNRSPYEIGRNMAELKNATGQLYIEKWGSCKGTTWYVREREENK